jgi:hypothetical protein
MPNPYNLQNCPIPSCSAATLENPKAAFSTPSAAIRGCASITNDFEPRGKPGKVAVIAAMRKLLIAVWSVATHRKPFVPIMPARAAP